MTATFFKHTHVVPPPPPILSVLEIFSVFGEDALVNVSVEKKDDAKGKLAGYIRIRSKTQGIALSLGDRITSIQRGLPESNSTKQ